VQVVSDERTTRRAEARGLAAGSGSDSYASPEAAREAAESEGMFSVIHNESLLKVDFIIPKNDAFNAARFSRRRAIDFGGFTVSVSSPEDLILAKLLWSRGTRSSRQHADVETILRSVTDLDWLYLPEWSQRLEVWGELQRLRSS
jgi:hypothetical protein